MGVVRNHDRNEKNLPSFYPKVGRKSMFNRQVSNIFMSTCLTYIHNLYIKLYLSKSKKESPIPSPTLLMYIAFEEVTNQEKKKKIRRDPSLVIWLDIYCPQNKMFVFCCDMYSCHCPPRKSKSRSVFNQNGFNGKNETTHCSNKKTREIRAIFPSSPPTLFSYILLLLRKPWNTTIENRTNLYLTYWCFSVKMKETLWKNR